MKSNIRILDKTKKCNRRCSSCEFYKAGTVTAFGKTSITHHYCDNRNSDEYLKAKNYWNCCEYFMWAENIVDKNDLECSYCLILPDNSDVYCNYYSYVDRKDMKQWAHFPRCIDKNCPIKHPELLRGEEPLKKSKRDIFKEHGRDFPCITCRKFFITKECKRENIDDCFDCEEFKCENCTQFGNLDCDGDVIV